MERLNDAYAKLSSNLSVFDKLLEILQLTQKELGAALGMERSRINAYIKGRLPITLKVARLLQEYAKTRHIHLTLDEIYSLGGKETKEIKCAKRCIELAKAKKVVLTLDEIFENDSGEEENE